MANKFGASNTTPSTAESCSFAKPKVKLHRDAVQREAVGEMQDPSVDSPGMMTSTPWDTNCQNPKLVASCYWEGVLHPNSQLIQLGNVCILENEP